MVALCASGLESAQTCCLHRGPNKHEEVVQIGELHVLHLIKETPAWSSRQQQSAGPRKIIKLERPAARVSSGAAAAELRKCFVSAYRWWWFIVTQGEGSSGEGREEMADGGRQWASQAADGRALARTQPDCGHFRADRNRVAYRSKVVTLVE